MEWKTLETKLLEYLPLLPETDTLTTAMAIDNLATSVTETISRAIAETTPQKKPSRSAKDGGTTTSRTQGKS